MHVPAHTVRLLFLIRRDEAMVQKARGYLEHLQRSYAPWESTESLKPVGALSSPVVLGTFFLFVLSLYKVVVIFNLLGYASPSHGKGTRW